MKRIFVLFVALLFPLLAVAAPFVKATVDAGTAQCGFYLDSGAVVVVAVSGTTCQLDVGTVSVGAHVVAADARSDPSSVWGAQISAKSPNLNFTRPAAPTAPSSLVLVP